jgi:hypothetical protein
MVVVKVASLLVCPDRRVRGANPPAGIELAGIRRLTSTLFAAGMPAIGKTSDRS